MSDSLPGSNTDSVGPPWQRAWRALTSQWQAIDLDLIEVPAPEHQTRQDRAIALSILVFALCLTLQRYLGSASMGRTLIAALQPGSDPLYVAWASRMYWAGFKAISYVGIPLALLRWVWGMSARDCGLRWHASRTTYIIYATLILGAMILAAAASTVPSFVHKYPMLPQAQEGPWYFWTWEIAYGFQFACLEFFFRGVLVFVLAKRFGHLAIFIAVLPYSMIHFTKPALETLASMAGGAALGTLSLRTGSIYGGVVAHCMIAWSMDVCALWQKGQLGHALGL